MHICSSPFFGYYKSEKTSVKDGPLTDELKLILDNCLLKFKIKQRGDRVPELPELEVLKENLTSRILDKKIKKIKIVNQASIVRIGNAYADEIP